MTEYFAMGGHAGFIWSSYGVAAIILIGLLLVSLRELRARREEVAALEAASPRRRQQTESEPGK